MPKQRLDHAMVARGLVATRSQAESWIKLGRVSVAGKVVTKSGFFVSDSTEVSLQTAERYVSRAGLKLASVAKALDLDFRETIVLDVGSSTGGFTDYALQHGARKVYAVDVGTQQLHPSLRGNKRIELHEKTDIRQFTPRTTPEVVVMDVSFISVREILPHIASIVEPSSQVVAMVKPQFESSRIDLNHNGIVKNDAIRRRILKEFEAWVKQGWVIAKKADSDVAGAHGNQERFYLLKKLTA